eukprot:303808-Amphidinium_carterae.1
MLDSALKVSKAKAALERVVYFTSLQTHTKTGTSPSSYGHIVRALSCVPRPTQGWSRSDYYGGEDL